MQKPFFYLLLFSLSILIDLVGCGLSPLVLTSLIHVYCHDMYQSTAEPKILFACLSFSFLLLLS
jgi:hypothetical protein